MSDIAEIYMINRNIIKRSDGEYVQFATSCYATRCSVIIALLCICINAHGKMRRIL